MSEDQWLQQRSDVVEDLKLRFRQNQIEQEGNDPAVTGVSFGTPHDLASIHMSSDEVEEKDKGGRPKEGIKFGQHKNAFGWDPVGTKAINQELDPENMKSTFTPDPRMRTRQNFFKTEQILKKMGKTKQTKLIKESLSDTTNDPDAGTMLDENNIL